MTNNTPNPAPRSGREPDRDHQGENPVADLSLPESQLAEVYLDDLLLDAGEGSESTPRRAGPGYLGPQRRDSGDPSTGDLQLEERTSLRRVGGLSTELTDVTEVEYRQLRLERVVLVGVWTEGTAAEADASMAELAALAETAGSQVLEALVQRRSSPDASTYIGSGKARELRDVVAATGADTVICDGELTPAQLVALEKVVKVKVVDRTALILDIFAQHATSREGKAQVELAQMQYMLPRLRGWGESLSRQAGGGTGSGASGGVGTRGPGETKIETDRRRIRSRTTKLRKEIAGMRQARETKRDGRRRNEVPSVAIAGYTNAGKSSLLNALTGAGVMVQDALFATLDPTTRRAELPDGREYVLTDTVGFVRHLPTQLVEAFRSTLEEVADADLLLHVVDGADPFPQAQIAAVRQVLVEVADERGTALPPELLVMNKIDAADAATVVHLRHLVPDGVLVSAQTGEGMDQLIQRLVELLPHPEVEVDVLLPYRRGDLVARVHGEGEVLSEQHTPDGTLMHARVRGGLGALLAPFGSDTRAVAVRG
ncbi:MAG: GTPase HflX [Mycobacteriaceae bacterium]